MANDGFVFKIDLKALNTSINKLQSVGPQIEKAIERLAKAAFNQAVAITRQKLKDSSNQTLFLNHLKFVQTTDGGNIAYLIVVEKEAVFLEEGTEGFSLKQNLKGRDSMIIPFNHNKSGQGDLSQQQSKLFNEIKVALKQNNIPLKKTITDTSNRPILSTAAKPRAAAMIKQVES